MNLHCPICEGRISVVTEYQGRAYAQERVPVGFECDDCYAEWNILGILTYTVKDGTIG